MQFLISTNVIEVFFHIWKYVFRYEYGNIGKQVYDALKDGAYHQFKAYVAKKAVIATGDVDKIRWL